MPWQLMATTTEERAEIAARASVRVTHGKGRQEVHIQGQANLLVWKEDDEQDRAATTVPRFLLRIAAVRVNGEDKTCTCNVEMPQNKWIIAQPVERRSANGNHVAYEVSITCPVEGNDTEVYSILLRLPIIGGNRATQELFFAAISFASQYYYDDKDLE
ncbi:hypothetical protein SEMRO_2665_G334130.1 [Seminavis robusta]|uniref:Uncharacterized protein n=1 Tax=Seminavis robusta TaxID=568900 RepID=A0A9N8HY20_9STRA|nr:hypothetical protein SEMRO_2665_G334130.1 [Seminavis robusta]|eukprot:Sro2665_g334130.1 n/a (159) ;mRNA; r:8968-9444